MWPHTGSWGTPDFGATELLQKVLTAPIAALQGKSPSTVNQQMSTQQGGSNLFGASSGGSQPQGAAPMSIPMRSTGGGTGGVLGAATSSGGNNTNNNIKSSIDEAAGASTDAAQAAAEAKRQAAMNAYNAKVGEANSAKGEAKGTYDWIIETLGSNKQDLLAKVASNEAQGVANYGQQEVKTKKEYDTAKQDILSTYRDLQIAQEKVLRGSGVGQSSRSQEAALRLNNLMGKDLSTVSSNEADSLALIGNAVTALKQNALDASTSIERESKSKADQAGLEYQKQIDTINANLNLSANEREDAYYAAEAKLAEDIAGIKTWAAQQKSTVDTAIAKTKSNLDDFIVNMTDQNGMLNAGLQDKTQATNTLLAGLNLTPLTTETGVNPTTPSVYQKPKTKSDLDAQLKAGQITQAQYDAQLMQLQPAAQAPIASAAPVGGTSATQDPLLRTLLGNA